MSAQMERKEDDFTFAYWTRCYLSLSELKKINAPKFARGGLYWSTLQVFSYTPGVFVSAVLSLAFMKLLIASFCIHRIGVCKSGVRNVFSSLIPGVLNGEISSKKIYNSKFLHRESKAKKEIYFPESKKKDSSSPFCVNISMRAHISLFPFPN